MGAPYWPPVQNFWVRLSQKFPGNSCTLRRRIKRRARELAMLEQQRCYEALVTELCLGRLDEGLIEWWEPARGGLQACEACKSAVAQASAELVPARPLR